MYADRFWSANADNNKEKEWACERYTPNLMCGMQGSLMFTDSVGHVVWENRVYGDKKIQLDSEGKIARITKKGYGYTDFIYENEEVYRITSDDSDLIITVGENLQLALYHYLDGEWVDSDTFINLVNEEVLAYVDSNQTTVRDSDETFVCVENRTFCGVAPGTTVVSFADGWTGTQVQIEVIVEELGMSLEYLVLEEMKDDLSVEGITLSNISFEEQNKAIKMDCSAYNQCEDVYWLQVWTADDRIVREIKLLPYAEKSFWERIWNELVLLPVKHEAEQGNYEAQRYLLSRTSTMTAVEIEAPYNGRVLLVDSEGHEVFEIKIPNLKAEPELYLVA